MESEKALSTKLESEKLPEKIEAAAIQFEDGSVFTGQIHADALIAAGEELGVHHIDKITGYIEVFVTSSGRFVDREKAGALAKAARQLDHLDSKREPNAERKLDSHDILDLRKDDEPDPWGRNF